MLDRRIPMLAIVALLAAFSVIGLRHQSRQLFVQLQGTQQLRDELNIEWGKYLLEEGAWSQHRRIESTAKVRLNMLIPQPDRIEVINLNRGRN